MMQPGWKACSLLAVVVILLQGAALLRPSPCIGRLAPELGRSNESATSFAKSKDDRVDKQDDRVDCCSKSKQSLLAERICVSPSATPMRIPSATEAEEFLAKTTFQNHIIWDLVPGKVQLNGNTKVALELGERALSAALTNETAKGKEDLQAMDIGTVNGCVAFELERHGVKTVYAVDIMPPTHFGFQQLHKLLSSQVTFVRTRGYELASLFEHNSFDLIVMSGVLYHLRHPIVMIDVLWLLLKVGAVAAIETAITETLQLAQLPPANLSMESYNWVKFIQYYAHTNPEGRVTYDRTNKFFPSMDALVEFFSDSGFEVLWQKDLITRGHLLVRKTSTRRFQKTGYSISDQLQVALQDPIPCA
ncbi:DUF1698 domain-containing protein [Durusdinium trenchii]|uniref:DUF1698 domain-containing protein n=1 Tax=Durusdinium trenchii TaxID=1381693 RepID=A0ABP0PPP6_9DINO